LHTFLCASSNTRQSSRQSSRQSFGTSQAAGAQLRRKSPTRSNGPGAAGPEAALNPEPCLLNPRCAATKLTRTGWGVDTERYDRLSSIYNVLEVSGAGRFGGPCVIRP
jgi:hypothetical protein